MKGTLLEGNIRRQLVALALPLLVGNVLQQLYNTVDSLIIRTYLGTEAFSSVGIAGTVMNLFIFVLSGFCTGISVIFAQMYGRGDRRGFRREVFVATSLGAGITVLLSGVFMLLMRPVLHLINSPAELIPQVEAYLTVIIGGMLCTFFYNICSGMLNAIGDTRAATFFLFVSVCANTALDVLFVGAFALGVAGAAWATVLSQLISGVVSLWVGLKKYPVLRLRRADFTGLKESMRLQLKTGFPMGFQMSLMCIGLLTMQAVVNSLGTAAVAGFTVASKVDQLSVLVNNAMMTAISNYVAQNFGANRLDRIRQGVRASLIQTQSFNLIMCVGILLLRHPIVRLFLDAPTEEIYYYSDMYLTIVAPCYFILGLLAVYRTAIQSMQNGRAPFAACMIELVMRVAATVGLSSFWGYTAVCVASPLAWLGACALLIPCYYAMMR